MSYKLFYSEKQRAVMNDISKQNRLSNKDDCPFGSRAFYKMDNGNVVEITQVISIESELTSNWDDAAYIGIGTFSHVEKRWVK